LLAGLIIHPMPGLDIYGYAGEEFQQAKYVHGAAAGTGVGNPATIAAGCVSEFTAATCGSQTKSVGEITVGLWDTIYKGEFGMLRAGFQYQDIERIGFAGANATADVVIPGTSGTVTPKANEQVFMTSLRYYPF
jgi:hypothetical protein